MSNRKQRMTYREYLVQRLGYALLQAIHGGQPTYGPGTWDGNFNDLKDLAGLGLGDYCGNGGLNTFYVSSRTVDYDTLAKCRRAVDKKLPKEFRFRADLDIVVVQHGQIIERFYAPMVAD